MALDDNQIHSELMKIHNDVIKLKKEIRNIGLKILAFRQIKESNQTISGKKDIQNLSQNQKDCVQNRLKIWRYGSIVIAYPKLGRQR